MGWMDAQPLRTLATLSEFGRLKSTAIFPADSEDLLTLLDSMSTRHKGGAQTYRWAHTFKFKQKGNTAHFIHRPFTMAFCNEGAPLYGTRGGSCQWPMRF